jgi:hypothetical protein
MKKKKNVVAVFALFIAFVCVLVYSVFAESYTKSADETKLVVSDNPVVQKEFSPIDIRNKIDALKTAKTRHQDTITFINSKLVYYRGLRDTMKALNVTNASEADE